MAASVRASVVLSFGLISTTVSVHSAKRATRSNASVCTGGGKHEPAPIKQTRACSSCGEVNPTTEPARKVAGGYVVIPEKPQVTSSDDLAASMKISAHPADALADATIAGGKAYFLAPAVGAIDVYTVFKWLIVEQPDIALVTRWASRGVASNYRLVVIEDTLALLEITTEGLNEPPEMVAPKQDVTLLVEQAKSLLSFPGVVTSFDAETYADQHAAKVDAILAASTPTIAVAPDQDYAEILAKINAVMSAEAGVAA